MMSETVCTLATPALVFGPGASSEAGSRASGLGISRALLVTDAFLAGLGVHQPVVDACRAAGVEVVVHEIPVGEPNETTLAHAGEEASAAGVDGVIGLGGGSALDSAKVAALLAAHGGQVRDYVNAPLGLALAPPGPLLPLLAIPTTAGTGSEVTAVAVLDLPDERVKTGIAHPLLRPLVALCDPDLTLGVPGGVTAATGIDALLHALEAFTCVPYTSRPAPSAPAQRPNYQGSHPLADVWVRHAIELAGRFLERAVDDGTDREARAGMMLAATTAGIGFGNAGVHIPHACAYPIGGLRHEWRPPGYPGDGRTVPHGIACALTAPAAFAVTHRVLPDRHREAARLLTGVEPPLDDPNPLGDAVRRLMERTGLPVGLAEVGYGESDLPDLVAGAEKQRRLLACAPLPVGAELLESVFRESL